MSKYKEKFLKMVSTYQKCNQTVPVDSNEEGLHQFFVFESTGTKPTNPNPYFLYLWNGKAWWEWTLNTYADLYGTQDWPGWIQLAEDFIDSPHEFKQLRQRLQIKHRGIDVNITPQQILETVLIQTSPPQTEESNEQGN